MANQKLKIFAIVPSGFCFGLQHVTIDFFKHFNKTESLFLVSGWNDGEFIKLLNSNGLKYTISWLGMFSRSLAWYQIKMSLSALIKMPRLYYDFFKVLKNFKPDVLFFANHHELILLYPALKLTKVPVVCHMHDPAPVIPFQKKTFAHYNSVVNHFIAISDNVRERTIELGCPPEKITTVHNGIELPPEKRVARNNSFIEQFNWQHDVFIVGITGQMTHTKGHQDLLSAFKIAYSKNPKLRLVIGGRFIEPLYSELQACIKEWQMENVIVFTGWLPSVNTFFNGIDLFVLASRHDEGYGLVVAEAMATNLPVIITHSGGAVEIVEDGINGYIVPKSDVQMMAEKISYLSANPELASQMGDKGRQHIEQNFAMKHQAGLLENLVIKISTDAIRK
ncbi:glycosyltransferase family 4 protein [Mucilaginibacter sp. HMF5004]|uniref:glycosyltransferase family 4 protein n=1 Tax=Mucilaginibacter rivuli TaxID=2857527 RepID=UPI001C5E7EEC|nr:glycosyltransferase family 4 protein [Mucilaginibacter rivuli]MBW4890091.1 glycosyltransferase family 4 protein [Mucilaginibacter rivuli]